MAFHQWGFNHPLELIRSQRGAYGIDQVQVMGHLAAIVFHQHSQLVRRPALQEHFQGVGRAGQWLCQDCEACSDQDLAVFHVEDRVGRLDGAERLGLPAEYLAQQVRNIFRVDGPGKIESLE